WYSDRGIPYRRGYLFHGPPGTGKTSFAVAIASQFYLPIYTYNLKDSGLTDEKLGKLIRRSPSRCLIVFDDIDVIGDKPGVSLPGLLTAIDGPSSHEGHILIMTTNIPDGLNDALVRPERIDRKV
ncbi:P-loop containing nucleoside triphosphate hydrolase protein, partial [Lasiosphaeria miniovina]